MIIKSIILSLNTINYKKYFNKDHLEPKILLKYVVSSKINKKYHYKCNHIKKKLNKLIKLLNTSISNYKIINKPTISLVKAPNHSLQIEKCKIKCNYSL
jgi:hypothetical protein